jgi:hypothetical protein
LSSNFPEALRIVVASDELNRTASLQVGVGEQVRAPGLKARSQGRESGGPSAGPNNEQAFLNWHQIEKDSSFGQLQYRLAHR